MTHVNTLTRRVITVNQGKARTGFFSHDWLKVRGSVFQLLLEVNAHGDWAKALSMVLPTRKGFIARSANASDDGEVSTSKVECEEEESAEIIDDSEEDSGEDGKSEEI